MRTVVLAFIVILATAVGDGALSQAGKNAPEKVETITGVVSQKDVDYVIAEPEEMKTIAVLQGVGFPNESFARFIGIPVRARGTLVIEKDRKILRIRNLADVQPVPAKQ